MIDTRLLERLQEVEGLAVRYREPMSAHCVWGVGGPALYLVAETEAAAKAAAELCAAERLRLRPWDGPSALVRDGGDELAWLRLGGAALGFEVGEAVVRVGAQLPTAVVAARFCSQGLRGMQALTGYSGTIAEAQRAGLLGTARLCCLKGRRVSHGAVEKLIDSHHILWVELPLVRGERGDLRRAGARAVAKRRGVGPGLPGMLFLDPKRKSAAERMAQSGLCGVRLRGLQIGTYEPNSVLNRGRPGRTQDLLLLLKLSQDRVKLRAGVSLESALRPRGRNQSDGGKPRRKQ